MRERYEQALRNLATHKDDPVEDEEDPWLDPPDDATPEQIAEAYGEGVQWTVQEGIESRAVRTIQACPLNEGWRLWDMFGIDQHDFRWLTPDQRDRCSVSRNVIPRKHLALLTLEWEVALDDARHKPVSEYPRHHHAETLINNHVVHIDVVDVRKYGPGRSVREFRIFVDGELAGRGGKCGCSLGFGGGDLPAVARIDSDAAITVDSVVDKETPVVELWKVRQSRASAQR